MLIDLRNAELSADSLRAEVCIIGGGLAGLVLAHRLAGQGIDVLLLETGGLETEPPLQRVAAQVEMLGQPHAGSTEGRTWALGGSALTWGGQLLPLPPAPALPGPVSPEDLADPRSPDSSWPVKPGELRVHQAVIERLLGLDELPYENADFLRAIAKPSPSLFDELAPLALRVSKFAPFSRRNLSRTLGRELLAHPKVRVLLHARATEILLAAGSERIGAVVAQAADSRAVHLRAEHFVLAAGTLETVRLLLASRSGTHPGLGNVHDQLGRNVHDHLTYSAATFHGAARVRLLHELRPWVLPGPHGAVVHSLKLEGPGEGEPTHPALSLMAHLTVDEPEHSGVAALRALLYRRQRQINPRPQLRTLLPQLPSALAAALPLAWSARVQHRRYVSPRAAVVLRLNAAQVTPSESRITLSDRTDAFGQSLPALRWIISARECQSLDCLAGTLRSQFARCGIKAEDITWAPPLLQTLGAGSTPALTPPLTAPAAPPPTPPLTSRLEDARHLMGGAVMGTDPRTSVVDANLQVHGIPNLHVASLAIFPDGRAHLPTFTLMALTLRLAERLCRVLRP